MGLALLAAAVPAATPRAQEGAQARFSSGVQAVEVYATVTDGAGEPVTGLKAGDFQLDDDGRPQTITTFAEGAFPLTVALGVDRSLSMAGEPLRLARRAAEGFLRQLQPGDRSMVVAISAEAEVVAPLDAPRDAQLRAVGALDAWSTTALRDAVVKTLDRLEPEPGRQALVVFSDGTDRYSQVSAAMTQYGNPLWIGAVDVDKGLDALKKAVEKAGLADLQAELEKQANAYLKGQ